MTRGESSFAPGLPFGGIRFRFMLGSNAPRTDLSVDVVGDPLLMLQSGVLVDQLAFWEDWPARTIRSLSFAPVSAANVLPVWRKS